MCSTTSSVIVWFTCKTCKGSFQKLNSFLDHKREYHLEEFRKTNCIVFEEKGIESNEETVTSHTTVQGIKETNLQGSIDPLPPKVNKNNSDHSYSQSQCHTNQPVEFPKTAHRIINQDLKDNTGNFALSRNAAATNSNLDCTSLNTLKKAKFDFKNTNNAPAFSDLGPHKNSIQTEFNPFVPPRRLNSQEPENPSVSNKASASSSCVKSSLKADNSALLNRKIIDAKSNISTRAPSVTFVECVTSTDPLDISSTATTEEALIQKVNGFFTCQRCHVKFNHHKALRLHLTRGLLNHQKRNGSNYHFCSSCNQKFDNEDDLLLHLFRHHATEDEKTGSYESFKFFRFCPTKCVFESENEETVTLNPTVQGIEDPQGCIDLRKVKVGNKNTGDRSVPQSQCQSAEFLQIGHQSIDQDIKEKTNDFTLSRNVAGNSANSEFTFTSLNTLKKAKFDIKSTTNAAPKLNPSAKCSDLGHPKNVCFQPEYNPVVRVRRLNSQEIENYSISQKSSSGVFVVKADNFAVSKGNVQAAGKPNIGNQTLRVSSTDSHQVIIPTTATTEITTKNVKNINNVFNCKFCHVKFNSHLGLNIHLTTCTSALHHGNRSGFCAECNQQFENQGNLLLHLYTRHATEKEKTAMYKHFKHCRFCPEKFLSESDLKAHSVKHITKKLQMKRTSGGQAPRISKYK